MNCQQKSGVFLNLDCTNTKAHVCSKCQKDICNPHTRNYKSTNLCEDCYWETLLFSAEKQKDTLMDDHYTDTTPFIADTSNTAVSSQPSGFEDGFGGGGFGGGGAEGTWTEGDLQSLEDTSTNDGLGLLGADDTFFYS